MAASSTDAAPGARRRSSWTGLIGAGLRLKLARRIRKLSNERQWSLACGEVQRRTLRSLLERAQRTEIGRELGFGSLTRQYDTHLLGAYRKTIAASDYESFRVRLARMREEAEPGVLWPGVIRDWAETSGTTGGQKYIPVSREMMRSNFKAALDIFAHAHRFGVSLPSVFSGRLLFLGGSSNLEESPRGVRTGDLSGLATRQIRWPLSEIYSPGPTIALMDDWPAKIDAMAELTASQDIRSVSGMASWSLVLFEKVLELARRRDASIACLREVWPHMQLFIHGGVKYAPFDDRVRRVWSGQAKDDMPYRLEVYPASEGFIAVQDRPGEPGMRLHTDIGNFYEFVPLEEIDDPDAKSFMCDEVETGQRYVVVMTTCAGLWRYVIGDVVEFDTVPDRATRPGDGLGPPRLRIVGRHRHFINAFGENLIVEDIERAVVEASRGAPFEIGEFTAAPIYPAADQPAGLELVVESKINGGESALKQFAETFDKTLRIHNVDYDTKRTGDLGMAPARITIVEPGVFHRWMAHEGKLGGQHKAPRCANHREIVDGLLGMATKRAEPSRERSAEST